MRRVAFLVALLSSWSVLAQQAPQPAGFDIAECESCHDAKVFENFTHTHHARKVRGSCAACHGDVATHAKMMMEGEGKGPIVSFKELTPQQVNQKCLSCHDKRSQAHWTGGTHERRGLSCTTCHSVHSFKTEKWQLKTARSSEVCASCHQNVRAQTMRTSHHPIREGKMECSSCHNPHSSQTRGMLKADSLNELCYSCHTEKRGPFMWEHAPARENCSTCHQAHGSNHDKLLVAKMPYLCQRCHVNTGHSGTLYDLRNTRLGASPNNRAIEHACRNCHQNVHGSNAPSAPYLGR